MILSSHNLVLVATAVASLLNSVHAEEEEDAHPCGLWLAPSTISTESTPKLGLFAGVSYNEKVTVGAPDVAIPLVDFHEDALPEDLSAIVGFMEGQLWTGEFAGAQWEGNYTVNLAVPGVGLLANYHSGTFNLDWDHEAVFQRQPMALDAGKPHESRGAVSNYYDMTLQSTQPIHPGMELFTNFGDVWDTDKDDEDIYQDKLTRWDYQEADKVLDKMLEFLEKHKEEMTPDLKQEVVDFVLTHVMGTAVGKRAKVLRSLLPAHAGKLEAVKKMGGTFAYRNTDLVKTQKWLDKHGQCMDNLKAGPSTIPEAGRGAFSTRSFNRGDVIAPAPMLHISDVGVLNMYKLEEKEMENGETEIVPDFDTLVGKQLLLNYCFGHKDSKMVLFPISSLVSLINHKPSSEANAKLVWSSTLRNGDLNWRSTEPIDMGKGIGIVMEVVATRDFEQGDEVFIDYGEEWTKAWNEYKEGFKPKGTWPIKAMDLNQVYKTEPFKTTAEQDEEPYPDTVDTVCFLEMTYQDDGLQKITKDGMIINKWDGPKPLKGSKLLACQVLERTKDEENMYNYTVKAMEDGSEDVEVWHVPHYAIRFVDKPYQSDTFAEGAFRHWIGLPEAVVSPAWRNRRASA